MSLLHNIKTGLKHRLGYSPSLTEPEKAYDLWAETYDAQPDNLMLALDEAVFSALLGKTETANKTIADIGCGTGRHWPKLLAGKPDCLTGYDVSAGMLERLQLKFPQAETCRLESNRLKAHQDQSCDLLVSTLALAHIQDAEDAWREWDRVLKSGGEIILTDYHPEALQKGGDRTFSHKGKLVSVRNYIHPLDELKSLAQELQWEALDFNERLIDESVRVFYEKKGALHVFEKFRGMPIIYGVRLRKKDAVA
jgi:ubiquinone/menaquinone biosynthesis C-methylase UbiE